MDAISQYHYIKWIAPLGLISWRSSISQGQVSGLAEKVLKLSGNGGAFLGKDCELEITWDSHLFSLKGTVVEVQNSECIFKVQDSHAHILHNLLNSLRKSQHLTLCQKQDVEASDRFTGFSEFHFIPEALPDLNGDEISLETEFLNRKFRAPIFITGMTGGIERGQELNLRLAKAAEHWGIPMGIGSQRMALDQPEYRKIFTVKKETPNLFLIGNLGGSQLCGSNAVTLCQDAVSMIEADALAIHLNVIQECIQVEGSPQFRGLLSNLEKICRMLSVPVIVKEVGSGISPQTAKRLVEAGVSAIDCSGRGGTSWAYIEGLRSLQGESMDLARSFRDWGIPTAYCIRALRHEFPTFPLMACGGIRDGLTVAKALALGADMVGLGLPLLRAASVSEEELHSVLSTLIKGLHTSLLATGSAKPQDLKSKLVQGHPFSKLSS